MRAARQLRQPLPVLRGQTKRKNDEANKLCSPSLLRNNPSSHTSSHIHYTLHTPSTAKGRARVMAARCSSSSLSLSSFALPLNTLVHTQRHRHTGYAVRTVCVCVPVTSTTGGRRASHRTHGGRSRPRPLVAMAEARGHRHSYIRKRNKGPRDRGGVQGVE